MGIRGMYHKGLISFLGWLLAPSPPHFVSSHWVLLCSPWIVLTSRPCFLRPLRNGTDCRCTPTHLLPILIISPHFVMNEVWGFKHGPCKKCDCADRCHYLSEEKVTMKAIRLSNSQTRCPWILQCKILHYDS